MKKIIFIIFLLSLFSVFLFGINKFLYGQTSGPISVPPPDLITSPNGHIQIGVSQHYGGAGVYYKDDRIPDSSLAQGNIIDYSGSGTLFSTPIWTLPWSRTQMELCYANQRSYDPFYGFNVCPNALPYNNPRQGGYSGDSWAGNPNPTSVTVSNNQIFVSYRGVNYNFAYSPVPAMSDANRNEWQTDFWGDVRIYFHPTIADVAVVETTITYCKDMNTYCRDQWIVTQDNQLSTLFGSSPYGRIAYRDTSGNYKIINSGQAAGNCSDNGENWVAMLQLSSDVGIGIGVSDYQSVKWSDLVGLPKAGTPVGGFCGNNVNSVPSIYANQPKIDNFQTQGINRVDSILVSGITYNDFPRYQFQPGGWYKFTAYITTGTLDEIRSKLMRVQGAAGYPIISNVQVSNITTNSATITWDTDEPTTSRVRYGTTVSYGQQTAEDSNLVTFHSVTLTGLQPSTLYHFQVVSRDLSDNQSFSGDFTFTTLDNISPQVSSFDVQPGTTTGLVTASYTVTDDRALARVELWRTTDSGGTPNNSGWVQVTNRTISGTSSTGQFTDNLTSFNSYWYGIHVLDTSGNIGTESSSIRITVIGCGDGNCISPETCTTCSQDCGVCPPVCGDTSCNGNETCSTCPQDCGTCPPVCGDGSCNGVETCSSCSADCGTCPPVCGDSACNGAETCSTCASDCGVCPPACPDGACNGAETCSSCAQDCGICPSFCGDNTCNALETCSTCTQDCGICPPACPDGFCNGAETCSTCASDCGACAPVCGDGSCIGESCASCPQDCGTCPPICGDGSCDRGEGCSSCPTDCICPLQSDDDQGIIIFRNPLRAESFEEVLEIVSDTIRVLAIGIGIIMIIIAGIMIMTSAGSEERVTKGKNILKWTLIGVAITVSASFIIDLIKELLG